MRIAFGNSYHKQPSINIYQEGYIKTLHVCTEYFYVFNKNFLFKKATNGKVKQRSYPCPQKFHIPFHILLKF